MTNATLTIENLIEKLKADRSMAGFAREQIGFDRGPKWIRVYRELPGVSRAAVLFVNIATGFVMNAASWKKPARTLWCNERVAI